MKRIICFILVLTLLFVGGCSKKSKQNQGTPFYYCAASPSYSTNSCVILEEYRNDIPEVSLLEILECYLAGPQSSDLTTPFPKGLVILSAEQDGDLLQLVVSMEMTGLSGLELTLACGCLTLTCLALTDAQQVQITPIYGLLDGQRSITMDKNILLLFDNSKAGE